MASIADNSSGGIYAYRCSKVGTLLHSGPLADSHEIKVFYEGYFRQNKGGFIEILTKIKSKLTSSFLVFFGPQYLNPCYDG